MKKVFIPIMLTIAAPAFAQIDNNSISQNLKENKSTIKEYINSQINNPENWNNTLDLVTTYLNKKDTVVGKWFNNLNLEFKTFQNKDSTKASLGLSYDLNIERAWIKEKEDKRKGLSVSFETKGNIAFNKNVNPYDFLNSKFSLNLFSTKGGVWLSKDFDVKKEADIRLKLSMYKSTEEILASTEWKEINDNFKLKNSWIVKYDLNAGFESNQDFSDKQYTLGVRIGTSLKSWDKNNIASKLNFIDYPFEFVRKLTKYNGNIHPGITIPTLLIGFDLVNPNDDVKRKEIEGTLKVYPRLNFEIGFRTVITEISNQVLYFNSAYKYYREIGASINLKENNYNYFSYFTASLTTSSGLFISYSNGKLPFDRQNEAVYELGFKYKFQ